MTTHCKWNLQSIGNDNDKALPIKITKHCFGKCIYNDTDNDKNNANANCQWQLQWNNIASEVLVILRYNYTVENQLYF